MSIVDSSNTVSTGCCCEKCIIVINILSWYLAIGMNDMKKKNNMTNIWALCIDTNDLLFNASRGKARIWNAIPNIVARVMNVIIAVLDI